MGFCVHYHPSFYFPAPILIISMHSLVSLQDWKSSFMPESALSWTVAQQEGYDTNWDVECSPDLKSAKKLCMCSSLTIWMGCVLLRDSQIWQNLHKVTGTKVVCVTHPPIRNKFQRKNEGYFGMQIMKQLAEFNCEPSRRYSRHQSVSWCSFKIFVIWWSSLEGYWLTTACNLHITP